MFRGLKLITFGALLLCVSLTAGRAQTDKADQVAKVASKAAAELLVLLTPGESCEAIGAKMLTEYSRFNQHVRWLEIYVGPASGVDIDYSFLGYMRLNIADAALKAGCLETANEQYRQVLLTYPSLRYLGLRDRAKVGIEDVRAKSAARDSKLKHSNSLKNERLGSTPTDFGRSK